MKMRVETGVIPGGWYVSRKVVDEKEAVREGKLPMVFEELARRNASNLDRSRPSIELYRSRDELYPMAPINGRPSPGRTSDALTS